MSITFTFNGNVHDLVTVIAAVTAAVLVVLLVHRAADRRYVLRPHGTVRKKSQE